MLDVKKCIGSSYAMAKEDGICLYETVLGEIQARGVATLDFQRIERATSLFFNESLCKIVGTYGLASYQKKIVVQNMSDTIKIIYLRALNLTIKKMEDPSIYNDALREGIKTDVTN